jgi:hypothetical protein
MFVIRRYTYYEFSAILHHLRVVVIAEEMFEESFMRPRSS